MGKGTVDTSPKIEGIRVDLHDPVKIAEYLGNCEAIVLAGDKTSTFFYGNDTSRTHISKGVNRILREGGFVSKGIDRLIPDVVFDIPLDYTLFNEFMEDRMKLPYQELLEKYRSYIVALSREDFEPPEKG
jgi:hypothetical protein